MLTACKQPGLHQAMTLMFMLLGLEISKALRERIFEKKLPEKMSHRSRKKKHKKFYCEKNQIFLLLPPIGTISPC